MSERRGSVLIVEDEGLLLDIIATEVEEQGFRVIRAMTAEAALDVLESQETIDILFTDIRLPGPMNGWRLAEKARQLRRELPIMYATGYTEESPRGIRPQPVFPEALQDRLRHQGDPGHRGDLTPDGPGHDG